MIAGLCMADSPPAELEKICPIYARLMEEIKRSHSVIEQILSQKTPMPQMAAFEFCYLQLRKICEVFALGCLAAHGDIPEVRSRLLQRTYSADKIMKQLTRIHSRFYPVPSKQTVDQITQRPIKVTPDYDRVSDERGVAHPVWRMWKLPSPGHYPSASWEVGTDSRFR